VIDMYREFSGIACIADYEIPDRHAVIPKETLERLCGDFRYKPLWCRPDLCGHTDWSYQFQIGTITSCKMVGPLMMVKGILHKQLPKHTTETLGMSIDTDLASRDLATRQWFGMKLGLPWIMNDFKPLGITVVYQHLCAIDSTTFSII